MGNVRHEKQQARRAARGVSLYRVDLHRLLVSRDGLRHSDEHIRLCLLVSDGHERRDLWRQSGIRRRQYAPVHRRWYDRVYDSDPGGVLNARTIVGADAYIGPLGNCESAVDSRKTLLSVGGQSRPPLQRLRVYLKTPNAPGQRAFLRCAAYHSARRVSLRVRSD